ncbi:hypothetical protein EK21DRAFT_117197 [Setomelanomma holmii]|uniref:Uncharacterized protein n=1 Tax=Setomelanomma holmii TaxID=210430 RepID=A0A9P4GY58_9PLEO|nr:hypothetical protein EK21DRAFT_117197 [Setomelanomma holmii]
MCVDLATRYLECGHKIVSKFPCGKKKCKETAKCTKEKPKICRLCSQNYTLKISKERDDAISRAQEAEIRLKAALREKCIAEEKARCLEKSCMDALQQVRYSKRARKEVAEPTPPTSILCTEIEFTYACRHTAVKHWCPTKVDPVGAKECRFQQRLKTSFEESCGNCRHKEAKKRDDDLARLQRRCPEDECGIREAQHCKSILEEALPDATHDCIQSPQPLRTFTTFNLEGIDLGEGKEESAVEVDYEFDGTREQKDDEISIELTASWNQDGVRLSGSTILVAAHSGPAELHAFLDDDGQKPPDVQTGSALGPLCKENSYNDQVFHTAHVTVSSML